ncbi:MAG TPA: N-acyl-D-glutamate deacylase [Gammaproteobacteria bacterium]|nr:N-acyl-D-glutamate deacylase [Gammaproteobacteria bacterium]
MPASGTWDVLFKNALVFDGTGAAPEYVDVAVRDGRIADKGAALPERDASRVIDLEGQWLMPGLLDIHTHFDLEVEVEPGLPEAVRHGTTTAVVSNCSLGLAFGAQKSARQNPVVDCFARVENIPKHVLEKVAGQCDWNTSRAYLEHFSRLPLGPNIVPMIPHSMLRVQVMGLQDSIRRDPDERELEEMCRLVEGAMEEGYVGFSTDALPFHYLANDPNRRSRIPTHFASFRELRRITRILRRHDRVWQATPPKDSRLQTLRNFLLTSGRLFGRPLKVTAVAALDVHTNHSIAGMGLKLTRLLNSRLVNGRFRLQALSAPFKVWADGPITPLAEEIPELRELNEPDLEDRETRRRTLDDPDYVRRFRRMWFRGKSGFNIANLKRRLNIEDLVLNRRLDDMFIGRCPVADWTGESMESVYRRLRAWQAGETAQARSEAEAQAFAGFPNPVADDADFFLHLLRRYDTDLRWHTTTANRDPEMVRRLLFDPQILPGFNDSGAHLTNMAFYDCNLRTLKLAAEQSLERVSESVRRLTREPADFFSIDAGGLEIGDRADLVAVDPRALANWDPEQTIRYEYRPVFHHHQMVNRSEGVVTHSMIGGTLAWENGAFTEAFGRRRMGRALRDRRTEGPGGFARHGSRIAA